MRKMAGSDQPTTTAPQKNQKGQGQKKDNGKHGEQRN